MIIKANKRNLNSLPFICNHDPIIYVFTIATRDYGTVAFENISLLGEYMNAIIMKAFVRVTLFEPTILTSSFTNLKNIEPHQIFCLTLEDMSSLYNYIFRIIMVII